MNKDVKSDILREQIRLAMQQLPPMQAGALAVTLTLCYSVRDMVPQARIVGWFSLALSIMLSSILLYNRFGKVREGPFAIGFWKKAYLLLSLVSGIFWGLSAFMIIPAGHFGVVSFIILVMGGVAATISISHSAVKFGPATWIGPCALFYVIHFAKYGEEFGYSISFVIVLYVIVLLSYSSRHNKFITSAIAIKLENLELLEEVRKANDSLLREIAERNFVQKTLAESEKKFRLAFQTCPDPVSLCRLSDGVYLDMNESFTKTTGYPRDHVIGKTNNELHIWCDPKARERMVATLRSTGSMANLEASFRSKNGRILVGLMSASILKINQEDVILSITRDITERKRVENALRESEEHIRSLFDNMLDGFAECKMIFEGDRPVDFEFLSVNHAFGVLTGLKNVVGRRVTEVVPCLRERNPEMFEIFSRVALTGHPERFETYMAGLGMWLTVSVYSHEKGGFVFIFDDISDRKESEFAIKLAYEELERRVDERTFELKAKTANLEEVNTALKVLLDRREEDRKELEDAIAGNLKSLVLPYVEKLQRTQLSDSQATYLSILQTHLTEIESRFVKKMSLQHMGLTPTEMQVAVLIRDGRETKDIAEVFHVSAKAIEFHRNNIRRKLRIKNKKQNLRSHLAALS